MGHPFLPILLHQVRLTAWGEYNTCRQQQTQSCAMAAPTHSKQPKVHIHSSVGRDTAAPGTCSLTLLQCKHACIHRQTDSSPAPQSAQPQIWSTQAGSSCSSPDTTRDAQTPSRCHYPSCLDFSHIGGQAAPGISCLSRCEGTRGQDTCQPLMLSSAGRQLTRHHQVGRLLVVEVDGHQRARDHQLYVELARLAVPQHADCRVVACVLLAGQEAERDALPRSACGKGRLSAQCCA